MHIAILQRPGTTSPCDRWLLEADPDLRITIITSRDTVRSADDLPPGVRRILVDSYDTSNGTSTEPGDAVLAELLRLCETDPVDRVYANSEDDVLRAAEARTLFTIPGQKSRSALAFRDKAVMKSLFADLATPPVPHLPARCVEEAADALHTLGPIVLKPRDGAGSVQVRVFTTVDALTSACRTEPALITALHGGRLMAEQYVAGSVCHADVLLDGPDCLLVSPGRYTAPPHRFATENMGSVMLDEDSDVHHLLAQAARDFVKRLPADHGVSILHMEFLRDGVTGRFFAGEVACRSGGALIRNSLRHTYGIDPSRVACLLAAGRYTGPRHLPRIAEPTGWILWLGGPRLAVPHSAVPHPAVPVPTAPPPWLVEHYTADWHPGTVTSSVDGRAAFLVRGRDEAEILQRLHSLSQDDAS